MHPFTGSVDEVPLKRAPLVSVVCQVRFPTPIGLDELVLDATRRALAVDYPICRQQAETVVVIGPNGVTQQQGNSKTWNLSNIGETWRIVLGQQMASIETTAYDGRGDFIKRLTTFLEVVEEFYKPPVCDRIGVRYVNRIDQSSDLALLEGLVKPIALAGLQVPHQGVSVRHSFCDTVFVDAEATTHARWGWLPAGAVIDPGLPVPSREHWMLDLDVFTDSSTEFESTQLLRQAETFSKKAYLLFRWLITDKFVDHFRE